jgi:hypothetical protein
MREIKLRLEESDLQFLDNLATENKTTRADIIRRNLHSAGLSSTALHSVTTAIRQRTNGTLSRQQAEHVAAIAISTLAAA